MTTRNRCGIFAGFHAAVVAAFLMLPTTLTTYAEETDPSFLAHYTFDETTGMTAVDSIGGHNATLTNFAGDDSQWIVSPQGNALQFDGTDDSALAPGFELGGAMAVSAWVKYDDLSDGSTVFSFSDADSSDSLIAETRDRGIYFRVFNAGEERGLLARYIFEAGNWTHITVQVDEAGKMAIYSNGLQIIEETLHAPRTLTRENHYIGQNFPGAIADLKVYDRVLSPTEIATAADVAHTFSTAASSPASPACIEGSLLPGTTNMSIAVNGGTAFDALLLDAVSWIADQEGNAGIGVTLSATQTTTIQSTAAYADGSTSVVTQDVTWEPTTLNGTTRTIRINDSLLLTVAGAGTNLEIDADGDGTYELMGAPGDKFPVQYVTAGTYTAAAKIDGVVIGTATVNVVDANFRNSIACEIKCTRQKRLKTAMPNHIAVTGTDGLVAFLYSVTPEDNPAGHITVSLRPHRSGTPRVLARAGGNSGPVIAIAEVEEFSCTNPGTTATITGETATGIITQTTFEMTPKVGRVPFYFSMHTAGPTFGDSTNYLWASPPMISAQPDGSGLLNYSIITPFDFTESCMHDYQGLQWDVDGFQNVTKRQNIFPLLPFDSGDYVKILTPETSIVSPACVEGRVGADATSVDLTVGGTTTAASRIGTTHWWANVALSATATTDIDVTGGSNTASQSITWTAIDIATTTETIKIRLNDSLLLACSGNGTTLKIDDNYNSATGFSADHVGAPGEMFVRQFTAPGIFYVQAQIDDLEIATIEVLVIGIDLQGSTACEIGFNRLKTITVLGGTATDVTFTSADTALMTVGPETASGSTVTIELKPKAFGTPSYLARLSNGSIIVQQEVDEFNFGSEADTTIDVVEVFPNGSLLVETNVWMLPHVADLDFQMHIFVNGVTFEDSTLDLTVLSNDMTDENGQWVHPYRMIALPNRGYRDLPHA